MADVAYQAQIKRLQSQSSIRQVQNRNQLLQRQQQIQQLQQQQKRQQEIARQQSQQSNVQTVDREALKQNALSFLLAKGKANESFRQLTKQEQAQVQEQANELEGSRARVQAERQVISIEEQLGQRLSSQVRQELIKETLQTGQASLSISQFAPSLAGGFQGPVPRGFSQEAFSQTGQLKPISQVEQNRFQGPVQRFTDPKFFAETGGKRQLPLEVKGATGTFEQRRSQLATNIKQSYKAGDLPQVVRSAVGGGAGLFITEGARRTAQALQDRGIATEGPLSTKVSFPTEKIVGDIAIGSLFAPAFSTATAGQVVVSRYVKNGIVYEIDSAGQVVSSTPVSKYNENLINFKQLLDESAVFKKADSFYPNEANLRMQTRELIKKAQSNPKQLEALKQLYSKSGRSDLFKDIFEQEIGEITKTNIRSASAIKDKPVQLLGSGQATASASRFAGTGQYERTDMVSGGIPQGKIQNPSLLSNPNVAFGQSSFNSNRLTQTNSLGSSTQTKQSQVQSNILGLRQPQETKTGQRTGQALSLGLGQATKQQSILRQRYNQMLQFKQRTGRRTGRPTPKIRLFGLPESESSFGKTKGVKDSLGFAVEVKKRGKFLPLGKPLSSIGEAVTKGTRFVDYDIARTFRVKDAFGNVVSLKNIPVGFRQSKTVSGGLVELSKGAINMFGEKSALRKGKRRSKNVFGF